MDPLDPDVWRRIGPILDEVLDAKQEDRERVAEGLCGGDSALREAVLRLATSAELKTDPLDRPAAEVAADLLTTPPAGEPTDLPAGTDVGGYRIVGLLGRGGMGDVYRALHPTLEREVALKVLADRLTRSAEARQRLIDEARAVSALDHLNIQTVYDAGETGDGRVFVAFALYEGPTLRERLDSEGPLVPGEAAALAAQLARGLGEAHRRGIVHRDVKPSNLIALDDGRLKILDFGVAKRRGGALTRAGSTYGTISYMSPEQTSGEPVDAPTDVWATGVVLYEMLTGRRPFRGESDRTLIDAIRHDDPPALAEAQPDVPDELAGVVMRCLAKDPDDRFGDMDELATALAPAASPDTRGRARSLPRAAVAATALATLGIVAYGAFRVLTTSDGTAASPVTPAAAAMTILPLVPVPEDSALARLGRQLAVTLSTNLDGIGSIRTTEGLAVIASSPPAGDSAPAPSGSDIARRFSTTSYLQGTLLKAGDGRVRVDAALHEAATGDEIARASASGPVDDIFTLTDSVTLSLLRAVWRDGPLPAPSLAALTTPSVAALRAYLDGELLLSSGRFIGAVEAFDSAFRTDTTFWFALWRSLYPRTYEGVARLDSTLFRKLFENRARLPEADRLLLETRLAASKADELAAHRDIVRRFPGYRPGWWAHANWLVHNGSVVGEPLAETRRALERTLELHPDFFPAWEHLFWIVMMQRDEARARDALARLEDFGRQGGRRMAGELLPTYRALYAGIGGPLEPTEIAAAADAVGAYRGPLAPFFGLGQLMYGDPDAQHEVSSEVLARGAPPGTARWHRAGLAFALAARGDWRGALEIASAGPLGPYEMVPLTAYGFAAAAAWLGELPADEAAAFRPEAAWLEAQTNSEVGAEVALLDGLVGYARGDGAGLASARDRAAGVGGADSDFVEATLAAYRLALDGDSAAAGRALADLEEKGVDAFARRGGRHPWLTPINRIAAARWLSAAGDTARALRLLGWEETFLPQRARFLWPAGIAVSPHSSLLRARLHAGRGDAARATFHYETVLDRYDRAQGLAIEAEEELEGLGEGEGRGR